VRHDGSRKEGRQNASLLTPEERRPFSFGRWRSDAAAHAAEFSRNYPALHGTLR
jgi:hypothetical protein